MTFFHRTTVMQTPIYVACSTKLDPKDFDLMVVSFSMFWLNYGYRIKHLRKSIQFYNLKRMRWLEMHFYLNDGISDAQWRDKWYPRLRTLNVRELSIRKLTGQNYCIALTIFSCQAFGHCETESGIRTILLMANHSWVNMSILFGCTLSEQYPDNWDETP